MIATIAIIFALDGVDGYIARRRNETSKLGAVLDTVADRIIENTFWIYFTTTGHLPLWMPIAVMPRGFITDSLQRRYKRIRIQIKIQMNNQKEKTPKKIANSIHQKISIKLKIQGCIMKYFTRFLPPTFYLCLSLALFVGCTETQTVPMTPPSDSDNQTDAFTETGTTIDQTRRIGAIFGPQHPACNILTFDDGEDFHYDKSDSIPPPSPQQLHVAAFTELYELRQRFDSSLFAENFRLLRVLINSENYLAFLSDAFPRNAPYSTLNDFWKIQPPPTEELLDLFQGLLENPNEKQIAFLHSQSLSWQCSSLDTFFYLDHANGCGYPYPLPFIPQTADREHMKNAIYFATRHSPLDLIGAEKDAHWVDPLLERRKRYAEDTNDIQQKKIRGFFNTYGADTGMLWLAIQEPTITGFILSNFTHENMLKAWIKDGYDQMSDEHP